MECDHWTEALSAMADGEDPGVEPRLLQAHLARCPDCRSFAAAVDQLTPASRLAEAPRMPDLSAPVVRAARLADRAAHWSIVRVVLGVVAIQIVILALPNVLAAGDDEGHDARHLAAFSLAYAVGLAVVVVRPARARTMLPVAAVLAGALILTAAVDVARGDIPLVNEGLHLPEILSVGLVWLLANPVGSRRRSPTAAPRLRVVDADDPATRHGEAR